MIDTTAKTDLDNQSIPNQVQNTAPEQKTEDPNERNWKAFLEKRKEEQRMLADEQKRSRELEAENFRRQKDFDDLKRAFEAVVQKKEEYSPYDNEEPQEKIIEKKVEEIISKRDKERMQVEESRRQREESVIMQKEMPDFTDVCSTDNLAYLEYYYPEMATPLAMMKPGLEKNKLVYQAVKKHVKMDNKSKDRIDQNINKPKSVHSAISNERASDENHAAYPTEERRSKVWAEMQRLMSGLDEN